MTVCRSWPTGVVATLVLVLLPMFAREGQQAATTPGPYVLTDLGTFGNVQSANANDINDAGQAVGYAANRPFVWQNGVKTDLGTLGGNSGIAHAINGVGQVVGVSNLGLNSGARATLWDNGQIVNLTPGLAASEGSAATGINDAGEIVGNVNYSTPFIWRDGTITPLGDLGGGGGGYAADINNAGQVVGSSYTAHVTPLGNMQHPFLWENGVMRDLGLLAGDDDAGAAAINNLGQIVGASGHTDPETYETAYHAFLYENGVMTALPVPSFDSYAADINDSGVVVGTMRAGGGFSKHHAFIYADGVVTNLNSLIPSDSTLHLAYAQGINNAGQIVGIAYDERARYHAFLLTPAAPGTSVLNIGDASVIEGHTGTRSASLTLTLAPAASQSVTVSYGTGNGSAAAGSDYQSASGEVTFEPGQTTRTITVLVNGDRAGEPDETFLVNLSQATGGAVIADAQGAATIVDDEPRVSVGSVTKNEGNSGSTPFVFTVSLSAASDAPVSLSFATASGSAGAGDDYEARSGVLAFNAGETSKTISVAVRGDRKFEWQEVFYVRLSGASGAVLAGDQGTGVIRNDDR